MRLPASGKTFMLIALTGVLYMGATGAYFSSFDREVNRIAVGKNDTEIQEHFPDPPDITEQENPQYEKKVWVSNTPSGEAGFNVDCFVRASVSFSNQDVGQAVTFINLDTVNWVYDSSDGYYYYVKKLREGESTTPLFTGVSIESARIDPLYGDLYREFQITVYEESVQAGGFEDYRSAWDYYTSPGTGT